ncbi:MAG: hypothetical protein HOO99_06835 [Hyphomicrobiaceae bacterium]|nr:hypothetical protein [Hyphomicrobiaceae bacterium]
MNLRRGHCFALVVVVAVASAITPSRADVRQADNSRILLDLPPNFAASTRFSGFQDDARGASIVLNEFPLDAYDAIARGFTADALQQKGIVFISRGSIDRPDLHFYVRARQNAGGQPFEKFFLVFKADDATVLISANVPQVLVERGDITPAQIETIYCSAKLTAATASKPLFALSQLGRFKSAGRFAGTAEAYTLSGRLAPAADGKKEPAVFIVAPALDKRPIPDPTAFAERALQSTPNVTELTITKKSSVEVSGLKGVVLEATAIARDEDRKLVLYQMILLEPDGGYFRVLGTAPASEGDAFLADFRLMAQSFRLTK